MALSTQTDSGQDHQASEGGLQDFQDPLPEEEKGFTPNPDARPFIPGAKRPGTRDTNIWQGNFLQDGSLVAMDTDMSLIFQAARQYGGILLDSFTSDALALGSQENPNMPPLLVPPENDEPHSILLGDSRGPLKKHIAYHLLSNVLDDEIQEDHLKEESQLSVKEFRVGSRSNVLTSPIQRPRKVQDPIGVPRKSPPNLDSHAGDAEEKWPVGVASLSSTFALSLDVNGISSESSSLGSRRSLHEIWSPDPSPKGSFSSSPNEGVFMFNHRSTADAVEPAFLSSREVAASVSGSPSPPASTTPSSAFSSENFDRQRESTGDEDFMVAREDGELSPCSYLPGTFSPDHGDAPLRQFATPDQLRFSPAFPIFSAAAPVEETKSTPCNVVLLSPNANVFLPTGKTCALDAGSYSQGDEKFNLGSCAAEPILPDAQQPSPASSDEACSSGYRVRKLQVHFEEGQNTSRNGTAHRVAGHRTRPASCYSSGREHRRSEASCVEQLGYMLDDCLDQLRCLEKECKKAEVDLSKVYPARRPSVSNNSALSKLPANPTRVDKMIAEQLKEHHRVELLVGRVERVGSMPLHPNVGVALDRWLACIRDLQTLRKEELSVVLYQQSGHHYTSKSYTEKDLLAMSRCVKTLNSHTRSARTIVWCAMQMLHADLTCFSRSTSCSSLEPTSDRLSSNS